MEGQFPVGKAIAGGIILVLAIILTSCSVTTVDTGNRGVKTRFGEVIGEPLPEGLYFVMPFTTHIVEMNVRTLKWEGETQAYTRDVQQATIHFTLNYGLEPAKAAEVYRTVGDDWNQKLVAQVVLEQIKRVFGQYEAVNLIAERNAVSRAIETDVRGILAERAVLVSGLQITNIDYTPEFEKAVEAKVVAQQEAIREQNRSVQVKEQANQQILTAEGNARATVLNAEAAAQSIRIRAQALEQNAKLVEWEAVQKWDGKLPVTMMGGNAVPFVNLQQGR